MVHHLPSHRSPPLFLHLHYQDTISLGLVPSWCKITWDDLSLCSCNTAQQHWKVSLGPSLRLVDWALLTGTYKIIPAAHSTQDCFKPSLCHLLDWTLRLALSFSWVISSLQLSWLFLVISRPGCQVVSPYSCILYCYFLTPLDCFHFLWPFFILHFDILIFWRISASTFISRWFYDLLPVQCVVVKENSRRKPCELRNQQLWILLSKLST